MVYGNLDATARKINIAKFRAKKSSFLVVTGADSDDNVMLVKVNVAGRE